MENTTKALILSAAVLITIVIIGISVNVLKSTSGASDDAEEVSSALEAGIFNSQFAKYKGKQNGVEVNNLIRLVNQTNAKGTHTIALTGTTTGISMSSTYTVTMSTGTNGYITTINIH